MTCIKIMKKFKGKNEYKDLTAQIGYYIISNRKCSSIVDCNRYVYLKREVLYGEKNLSTKK